MEALLAISRGIDRINEWVGRVAMWLALIMVVIGAYNAIVRALDKQLGTQLSSNTYFELQWYIFAATFLLLAGYTLKHNGHVRVDVFYSRLNPQRQALVDLLGALLFVVPLCLILLVVSWSFVTGSFGWFNPTGRWEYSNDPGGLIRWPVKVMLVPGFGLLMLQALSEAIKNWAFIQGRLPQPRHETGQEVA